MASEEAKVYDAYKQARDRFFALREEMKKFPDFHPILAKDFKTKPKARSGVTKKTPKPKAQKRTKKPKTPKPLTGAEFIRVANPF